MSKETLFKIIFYEIVVTVLNQRGWKLWTIFKVDRSYRVYLFAFLFKFSVSWVLEIIKGLINIVFSPRNLFLFHWPSTYIIIFGKSFFCKISGHFMDEWQHLKS